MRALAPALHGGREGEGGGGEGCAPGSVVLTVATAADGLPMHLVALYAPSGGLGLMIKPLERRALLVRLGLGLPPAGAAAAPTEEAR